MNRQRTGRRRKTNESLAEAEIRNIAEIPLALIRVLTLSESVSGACADDRRMIAEMHELISAILRFIAEDDLGKLWIDFGLDRQL